MHDLADERQLAIAAREIHAIADDEHGRTVEGDEIGVDRVLFLEALPALRLAARQEFPREVGEAEAGADPALMSERERLVWAMEQCGWVQAKAARLLNMTPRQIGYALQKYHIEVKRL